TDPSGLDEWWLNDTTYFDIDNSGVVTNIVTPLPVGTYGLQVWVTDIHENVLTDTFTVFVQDTTAPNWLILPAAQYLAYGEALEIQLQATDLSGIAQWTVNDTINFAISGTGYLTSIVTLSMGVYGLNIRAYDPYGHYTSATITVTVQQATMPLEILSLKLSIMGGAVGLIFTLIGVAIKKEMIESKRKRIAIVVVAVVISIILCALVWFFL
ncbi:MAG: hypothetical protein ACFFDP_01175, partial [Promethearchaeota archaeon]